jgi:peroxiredoxin Q/BCP
MTSRIPRVLALFASLLLACGGTQRPDGGEGLLEVGAEAPDIVAQDQSGQVRQLSMLRRGGPAVLFFYPRDGTPGCTREACAFRDAWDRIQETGAVVIGVSTDDVESHARFAEEHELPFALLSDPSGEILARYGVPSRLGMAARVTFLIDADGRIARVFEDVDPAVHADEVIAALRALER